MLTNFRYSRHRFLSLIFMVIREFALVMWPRSCCRAGPRADDLSLCMRLFLAVRELIRSNEPILYRIMAYPNLHPM